MLCDASLQNVLVFGDHDAILREGRICAQDRDRFFWGEGGVRYKRHFATLKVSGERENLCFAIADSEGEAHGMHVVCEGLTLCAGDAMSDLIVD